MDRGRDACDVADPDGARERGGNRLERADRSRSCSFGPELSQDFTERDSKATKLNASGQNREKETRAHQSDNERSAPDQSVDLIVDLDESIHHGEPMLHERLTM